MNRCINIHPEALEYMKHINQDDVLEATSLFDRACDVHNITVDNSLAKTLIQRGKHVAAMVLGDALNHGLSRLDARYLEMSFESLYERNMAHCEPFKTLDSETLMGRVFALLCVIQRPIDIVQLTRLVDDYRSDEIDVDACLRMFEPFTLVETSRIWPFPKDFVQWVEDNHIVSIAPGLGHRMIARLIERRQALLYEDGYLIRFGVYHMLACKATDVIDQLLVHQTERFLDKMTSAFAHCLMHDAHSIVRDEIERLALDGYADEWLIEDTVQKLAEASYDTIAKDFLQRQTSGLSELFRENQRGKIAFFVGRLHEAKNHFERVIKAANLAAKPIGAMNDVSFAHEFLGEIAAEEGDIDKARLHFNHCLESIETLAHEDDRFDDDVHRAALFLQIGDLAFDVDDFTQALNHYENALTLYERMPAAHADAHSSVATTLLKIIDVFDVLDDAHHAHITIERLLDHTASRFEKEGSMAAHQDLAYAHARLGDRAEAERDIETALKHYRRVRDIYATIHRTMHSAESAHDLSFSHARLGELLTLCGDVLQTEEHKVAALHHAEFAQSERDDVNNRLNVEMHCGRLGEFYFQQTDFVCAKRYFERAFQMAHVSVSREPVFDVFESFANAAANLGDYYAQKGDDHHALSYYQEAYEAEKQALNMAPDPRVQKHQFAYTCLRLGAHHMAQNGYDKAKQLYEEAVVLLEALMQENAVDSAAALLANAYMHLSELHKSLGDKLREKHYWGLARHLNPIAYD